MSVEDLVIGPLVFATDIPVILTHKIREELQADFGNLNRALLTEISLSIGSITQLTAASTSSSTKLANIGN